MTTTQSLNLDTPQVTAALAALQAGRAHRARLSSAVDIADIARRQRPTGPGSRTAARKYSQALTTLDDFAQGELDYLGHNLETAIRVSNPGASQADIMRARLSL